MTRTDPIRTAQASLGILLALWAGAMLAGLWDVRLLNGVSVWAKPVKFNLSFALHLATLWLFLRLMAPAWRDGALVRWTMHITCTAILVELLYIQIQAARGRASHFNFATQWETTAYFAIMGGSAAVIMAGTLVIGLALWRGTADVGPGLRSGAVLGAVLGTVATCVTAGAMASGAVTPTGHWVGGELTDATGMPLLGWSTTGGDLRVSHFFATHLMQALPLAGWAADRIVPARARAAVWVASALGLGVVWVTFAQALAGQPLLALLP